MENFKAAVAIMATAVCALISAYPVFGQETMAAVSGAGDVENMSEEEAERLEGLLFHPVRINMASASRLRASGLFSQYQVATIQDYRSRHGDILSISELGAIDGFSKDEARALAPFISLASYATPGMSSAKRVGLRTEIQARSAWRKDTGKEGQDNWGTKVRTGAEDRWELAYAGRSSWTDRSFPPASNTMYAMVYGRGRGLFQGRVTLERAVIGDWNARFGQGLLLWNGFQVSGFQSLYAFGKRPTGLSPSRSYTNSSYRGAGVEFRAGHIFITSGLNLAGLRDRMDAGKETGISIEPFINASWYGRFGQIGATYLRSAGISGLSADSRWCLKGVDVFSEVALHGVPKASGGFILPLGEKWKTAVSAKWISNDGTDSAIGLFRGPVCATAEFITNTAKKQRTCKLWLQASKELGNSWSLSLRLREQLKTATELKWKSGIRAEAKYVRSPWVCTARAEGLLYRSGAWLAYAEAGRKDERISAFLRASTFGIDSWDDRIYVYERDAPGSFNVPAYYGRGWNASAYAGIRLRKPDSRLYLRASYVDCQRPNQTDRYSRTEFRMTYVISL